MKHSELITLVAAQLQVSADQLANSAVFREAVQQFERLHGRRPTKEDAPVLVQILS